MNSSFLGYNKKQVNEYLESINKSHKEELDKLEGKIDNSTEQGLMLIKEYEKLQKEKEDYYKEKKLMESAATRMHKTVSLINELTDKETSDIMASTLQKLTDHDSKLNHVKSEIKNTKDEIDTLMNNMLELIDVESIELENIEENTSNKKTACKIYPYAVKPSNTTVKEKEAERDVDSKELEHKEKEVMENEQSKEKKSENDESFWKLDKQQMTSDGTTIKNAGSVISAFTNNKVIKAAASNRTPIQSSTLKTQPLNTETAQEASTGSFWDDILESEEMDNVKKQPEITKDLKITASIPVISGNEAAPTAQYATQIEKQEMLIEKESQPSSAENSSIDAKADEQEKLDEGVKSPAVAKEINIIRHKYIVGKLAGEDLRDLNGRIIAAKNSVITSEVVEKAVHEGKLSELIVNMLLPD